MNARYCPGLFQPGEIAPQGGRRRIKRSIDLPERGKACLADQVENYAFAFFDVHGCSNLFPFGGPKPIGQAVSIKINQGTDITGWRHG
ncbi:MAG TPA: hypothetical protein PKW04_05690, partial [Novosphingobium sp.]|nr:hypothetical protein [Novosphingobium sp.]HQQ08160.1 hypothetical protein [Novosphingobium sp.]